MGNKNSLVTAIRTYDNLYRALTKNSDKFDLAFCEFQLNFDLSKFIEEHPIDGIEIKREATDNDILPALNPAFHCSNLIFKKPVNFMQSSFKGSVNIRNVVFEQGVRFTSAEFDNSVDFCDTELTLPSSFNSLKVKGTISFTKCKLAFEELSHSIFEDSVVIYDSIITTPIIFNQSVFKKALVLNEVHMIPELEINNSTIDSDFQIGHLQKDKAISIKKASLCDSKFNGQVQILGVSFTEKLNIHRTSFYDSLFVNNVTFNGETFFTDSVFHKYVVFENTTIQKHLSFAYSKFKGEVKLRKINIEKAENLSFTGVQIDSDFWLGGSWLGAERMKISGLISFQGAFIGTASIVRIFGINEQSALAGVIKFTNAVIRGLVDIRDVFVSNLSFDGTVVSGNIQENDTLSKAVNDRNTARLLKHEARKINNTVSALSYHRVEMLKLSKELRYLHLGDKLLLCLNKYSNNYGSSWLRGIGFTIISGLIFYSFFIMSSEGIGLLWNDDYRFLLWDEEFWAGFINYFWLPTGFNELVSSDYKVVGGVLGAVFFIIGKIFIAYGIYQTISAFRKYI